MDDNEFAELDDFTALDDLALAKNLATKADTLPTEKEHATETFLDPTDVGGEGDGGDDNEGGDMAVKFITAGDVGPDTS